MIIIDFILGLISMFFYAVLALAVLASILAAIIFIVAFAVLILSVLIEWIDRKIN